MKKIDFEEIISPISLAEFENKYWGQTHFHIERSLSTYYHHILSLDNIDSIINQANHRYTKAVKNDQVITPNAFESSDDIEILMEAFNQGASIIFNSLEKSWHPLKELCRETYRSLKICKNVFANVYFTPSNSQAFDRHVDPQDTLILQVDGSKIWKLYQPIYNYPLDQLQVNKANALLSQAKLDREIHLNAGDVLYVPRGVPHEVITTNQQSLHITLSIVPLTYHDIISDLVTSSTGNVEALRKSLPWNYFENSNHAEKMRELFSVALDNELMQVNQNLRVKASGRSLATYHHFFSDHQDIEKINSDTKLALRDGANYQVSISDNQLQLESKYNDFEISLENFDFQFVLSNKEFKVNEVPGVDSVESKIEFMKDLIKAGILRFAEDHK